MNEKELEELEERLTEELEDREELGCWINACGANVGLL